MDRIASRASAGQKTAQWREISLRSQADLAIGIDVGSVSSDVVVLDSQDHVLFSDYRRTQSRPVETLHEQLGEIFKQIRPSQVHLVAVTGATGRFIAELLDVPFVNEVPAQAMAVARLYPHLHQATLIEMGGQDSKLIFLSQHEGRLKVKDFALNTVCAAGTGSFLDQQAKRLGIDIEEEFGRLALQSTTVPRLAGRCSVFAKSDMIHLQQQATPTCDIIAGLCLALARSLKSNLGCGREFPAPIIFTGGVAANAGVVRAFENVLNLQEGQLLVPDYHFYTGAIGAIQVVRERGTGGHKTQIELMRLDTYLDRRDIDLANAPRRPKLPVPILPVPVSYVHSEILDQATEPIEAYLGVDVGSISTNVVVMDSKKRVLAKEYLMTAGNPLRAVRIGLEQVARRVAGKVAIGGAATTGSGRYLTGDFIGADTVINEISAQAAGAAIVNPQVDTIFEIGGQDSKYISLENSVIVDFEMNHACAAGTGSFLEEQAQRLGIQINQEFADLALQSDAPLKLGERCTVFIESDLINYQQQGAPKEDLIAGLAYSIVANYLNRVVGRRKIGNHICFQGGTAYNKAVWSAFEKVVGKPIMVPDHHEVTGALGAASIAAEYMARRAVDEGSMPTSRFRGFENLTGLEYTVESFTCHHCSNDCEIKKVTMPGSPDLYYGSRCDRYNRSEKRRKNVVFDAFRYREQKLKEYAGLVGGNSTAGTSKGTVGIPQALVSWQMLPLFATFFRTLGYDVILSGKTTKKVIRDGVEAVTAQPCYPVKVAYGHVAQLLDKSVDFLFIPTIPSMTPLFENNKHNQLCPYVQSLAYQVRTAFADRLGKTRLLHTPLYLGEGDKVRDRCFVKLGKQLGMGSRAVRQAIERGFANQHAFEEDIQNKGREILAALEPTDKLFVLISRPYNGCDEGINLELPDKLAELGMRIIPMDMLDWQAARLTDETLHSHMYWQYGQKILRAAEIIRDDPRLFAIYLSNFSCGPDSFIQTFFKDLMDSKPALLLELDEHSADAGVITRLEAFLESLKHYHPLGHAKRQVVLDPKATLAGRTLYIPYMGDAAYAMAACFRAYGQAAEVMPVAEESTLLEGRRFTTGKECLPCAIVIGEMMKVAQQPGFDPKKAAFFMPSASGPCRFGMYNSMQRLVLRNHALQDAQMIAPNQDSRFYEEFNRSISGGAKGNFVKDLWAATVGMDLLIKVLLRVRPFAKDPGAVRGIYETALRGWLEKVEKRAKLDAMVRFMASTADAFAGLEREKIDKPRVVVVGEIYVRNHPFANNSILARLESMGVVCELASLAEWIYYTNTTRIAMAKRRHEITNLLSNKTQDYFQRRIEKTLAAPLEKRFGKLAEEAVEHSLKLAEPYIDPTFEGEAILSIGRTIEACHQGADGVVNVMPFSCMPSTIVATQTTRISADCGGMPILNLTFDGQEDAALTTRLEAFVDQMRQRKTPQPAMVV
ncbi:MAG: hypothetical protein JW828_02980 [Sedimentisphaerales bacterium]|nr:hypothetical protein [Sedimentisphaerales bacterium]